MKIAILDRDGTLNQLGEEVITTPEDWHAEPGALEAVARLNRGGWHVVVATNQPGLGRGIIDVMELNAIHAKMLRQLATLGGRIDAVFYCPHVPDDACACRKPAPGLLEQIAERYGVEPRDVRVAGNNPEHLQAGAAIGARDFPANRGPLRFREGIGSCRRVARCRSRSSRACEATASRTPCSPSRCREARSRCRHRTSANPFLVRANHAYPDAITSRLASV